MKWNLHPASFLKGLAASVSVFTMCISPVAQGAAAASNKQLVNQFLKETGLSTKKMTVGQYWASVRHVYPAAMQKQMDGWVADNKNEMMPTIEATSFKDANGVEQVRLNLSKGGQSYSMTFTGNEEAPLKVNSVTLTEKDVFGPEGFDGVAKKIMQDPAIKKAHGISGGTKTSAVPMPAVSKDVFKKMSLRQRAEYLIRLRLTMESAEKVLAVGRNTRASVETENKYEFALQSMFGDMAYAGQLTGQPCVVAGYITVYGKNDSCGSEVKGGPLNADLAEQMKTSKASNCGGAVACNPLVYGYNNGKAFCVPKQEVQYATRYCGSDKVSPLRKGKPEFNADKKRIIESYMKENGGPDSKNIVLKIDNEGKVPDEQYSQVDPFLENLKNYLQLADSKCSQPPLKLVAEKRNEQASACEELRQRMIALGNQEKKPEPPLPPAPQPNPPTQTCEEKKPGSARDAKNDCTCEATGNPNLREENGRCVLIPAVVVVAEDGGNLPKGEAPQKPDEAKKSCEEKGGSFIKCNALWFVALAALIGIGIASWFKSKNKPPGENVPPAPPPGSLPTPTPVPTVAPPPVAPCPATWTVKNGVCTPPSVVPPPAVGNEGGNKVETPGRINGVR